MRSAAAAQEHPLPPEGGRCELGALREGLNEDIAAGNWARTLILWRMAVRRMAYSAWERLTAFASSCARDCLQKLLLGLDILIRFLAVRLPVTLIPTPQQLPVNSPLAPGKVDMLGGMLALIPAMDTFKRI